MSSDESTATNISLFSNRSEVESKNKAPKLEKWEINLIGNFLLNLYHRTIISSKDDWCAKKSEIAAHFSQFINDDLKQKLQALHGAYNIGTLLRRCGFLMNTVRGSPCYKIKSKVLFEFRNNRLKELDNFKINCDGIQQDVNDEELSNSSILKNNQNVLIEENLDIDENEPKTQLVYQGSSIQRRATNYCPTNTSCCICQEDFSTMDSYEAHIQLHGEDTDFEFLSNLDKFDTPIFNINYTLCKNSHYFCFEFETCLEKLIIEKIIIVQSRSFFYVHNMRVPYKCPESGIDRFFVDSHLFTIHVEQPIVLICHLEDSENSRIIEQHHFMRSEEFPKVNFPINPNRLPNKKLFEPKFELADYFPPKEIQDALRDDFYDKKLMVTSNEFRDYVRNDKKLQPQTIGASLNILLQIEDMDTIQEYIRLKQQNIKLRSFGNEYSFRFKPKQRIFLENILSAYDEVILTTRTDVFTNNQEIMTLILQNKADIKRMKNTFVGLIEDVNTGRITFKCHQKIDINPLYTVIFRPSRLNLRYQYRSLQLLSINMDFLRTFLFPTKIAQMPMSTKSLTLYNENINGEQLQAVRNMAEGPRNDATYIIFGPPGTGKTTTLVEGILQILKKPNTKILVTASSNSACDEVGLRLCKYIKKLDIPRAMVRIYSRSSEVRSETIDDELLACSNMYNGQFYPDIEVLHEYRIVICTLSIVAKLATGKFGRNANGGALYTHLFIDEVAASTEVEALMAITTILTPQSSLIISGDHKQLGPILQSKRAKDLGLDASLMDRLLTRDCYRVDVDTADYDRTIQTRLVRNYRSHPAIVNLYSGLYYNHSLESYAKRDDVSLCEIWHKSRNKDYPIVFHAIYDPSRKDGQSQSLYNLTELQVVMDYLKDLMFFGINGEPVKESDIGIISPYKSQFKRIQEELKLRKWFAIETGSVETFQGKEKNIIIVSFVRSGTDSLGFLDSPRRLNVTISRPKALLILIGNPKTLSLNNDFGYIIKECQRNNTFVGANGSSRDNVKTPSTETVSKAQELLVQLNKKMQDLKVGNADQENVDEISTKRKRKNRGKRTRRSKKSNERSDIDKNGDNKNYDDDEDDDDDESKDNDQLSTSILAAKNSNPINDLSEDRRGRSKERRIFGNENNLKPRDGNDIRKDADTNEENEDEDDDDEDDDDDDDDDDEDDDAESQDNGSNKSGSIYSLEKQIKSKAKSRKGYDMRHSKKSAAGNGGKISKQRGKGRKKNVTDKNKNLDKNKLDSIFDALPQVPTATTQNVAKAYTKDQLLQMQQPQGQQLYNNLQRNQYPYHNYPYFNSQTANSSQPVPNLISMTHQQPLYFYPNQAGFNYRPPLLPTPIPNHFDTANLSCFQNNTNKYMPPNMTVGAQNTLMNAPQSNSVSSNKNNSNVQNNNTKSSTRRNNRSNAVASNNSRNTRGINKNTSNVTGQKTKQAKASSTKTVNNPPEQRKPQNANGRNGAISKESSSKKSDNIFNTKGTNNKPSNIRGSPNVTVNKKSEQPKNQYASDAMKPVSKENSSNKSGSNFNTISSQMTSSKIKPFSFEGSMSGAINKSPQQPKTEYASGANKPFYKENLPNQSGSNSNTISPRTTTTNIKPFNIGGSLSLGETVNKSPQQQNAQYASGAMKPFYKENFSNQGGSNSNTISSHSTSSNIKPLNSGRSLGETAKISPQQQNAQYASGAMKPFYKENFSNQGGSNSNTISSQTTSSNIKPLNTGISLGGTVNKTPQQQNAQYASAAMKPIYKENFSNHGGSNSNTISSHSTSSSIKPLNTGISLGGTVNKSPQQQKTQYVSSGYNYLNSNENASNRNYNNIYETRGYMTKTSIPNPNPKSTKKDGDKCGIM